MNLQLQCSRNGQRTIQLPEQSPVPAGPETHFKYQTKDVMLGEHSTIRCFFFFFISISPWWTLVSLILSFSQHIKYFTDIIWEALGLFDRCSHDCVVCCNELPTSQLDGGKSTGSDECKDLTISKKKLKNNEDELPLHTPADTASVSSFSVASQRKTFRLYNTAQCS